MQRSLTPFAFSNPHTSQRVKTEPGQVRNDAGGYVYPVGKWEAARRFMIRGTEGGSYYRSQEKLTTDMVKRVAECLRENPLRLAIMAKKIISERRAIRPDYSLYVLAGVSVCPDEDARRCVLEDLRTSCNIPSHLFMFLMFRKQIGGGWGRGLRNGIAKYYNTRHPGQVLYHFLKYQQRYGWSHQDLMRKAHPQAVSTEHNELFSLMSNNVHARSDVHNALREPSTETDTRMVNMIRSLIDQYPLFKGYIRLWHTKPKVATAAKIIRDHRLTREMVPTNYLKYQMVWNALLQSMPTGALIRNLINLGSRGVLADGKFAMINKVADRLCDVDAIQKAGIHPISVLIASMEYAKGVGRRGKTWEPVMEIRNALNTAFHNAFGNIVPSGKRILLAVDSSPSMQRMCHDVPDLHMCTAAAVLAMSFVRSEPNLTTIHFNDTAQPLSLGKNDDLGTVAHRVKNSIQRMGGTDCASPINWAFDKYRNDHAVVYDAFVLLTDCQTWSGRLGKPYDALQRYRRHVNPEAKLVTVQMESNGVTLGAPEDENVLDCIGFDSAMQIVVTDFLGRESGQVNEEWNYILANELADSIPF